VEALHAFFPALALDTTIRFRFERITVKVHWDGMGQEKRILAFHHRGETFAFAKSFNIDGQAGLHESELHKFILYDQGRQQLYLSATDHVAVST